MRTLVMIVGATGVGKTGLAVRLARRYGSDVVSADSRQVYRELRIGVARPTDEELSAARHWFVASRSVTDRYSSGQYGEEALGVVESLFRGGDVVVGVGGSMLYVEALCRGLDSFPAPDPALRGLLTARLEAEGVGALGRELARLDGATWARIDRANGARVVRALEVCLQTGRPYSSWLGGARRPRDFRVVMLGLRREWGELDARLSARVDGMLRDGLVEEVRGLLGYRDLVALRSVGYREVFPYLDGACSLDESRARVVVNTRRYARRQMRWWGRDAGIGWFHPDDAMGIDQYLLGEGL